MENTVLDFDKAHINFQNCAIPQTKTQRKNDTELSYCVGQAVHFNVTVPLSTYGREKLKIPHPPHSPASSNLLKCFIRHLSSSLDVKPVITPTTQPVCDEGHVQEPVNSPWYSGTLQASQPPDENTLSFVNKTEPFLTDCKIYNVPFQMRVLNIPAHCDTAEIQVEIRQGQRLGPDWLSSPTRSDPLKCMKEDIFSTNKLRQKIKVIHPPDVRFQHKAVAGKQLLLLQVHNNTSHSVSIEDCSIMPESCPVKVCKHSSEIQSDSIRKPCLVHGNMVKLLNTEAPAFPVELLPDETISLMYNLHLTASVDYLAKEEVSLVAHLKWHLLSNSLDGNTLTAYSLPAIKIKQAHFVMSARCKENRIQAGDSFTVTYCVSNRLQDFLSVKLYWNPTLIGSSKEDEERLRCLTEGVLCCDPQVHLGSCPYGSVMEAQVNFQSLRPGLYEVCKHMKINLRYLIPSENEPIASPSSHLSSQSGDDKLSSVSEEIWRERSGSGSSYNENDCPPASERRLSWANKSYSVGDLAEKLSSPKTKVPERPKQLQSEPKQSSTKYEQMLLNPANFLKNSCEVYVAASKNTRPSASEEET